MLIKNDQHKKIVLLIGLIAAITAVALSAVLACKQAGVCTFSTGCSFNGQDGCAELGKLPSSKLPLVGISVAWAGLFYYLYLGGLFIQLLVQKTPEKLDGLVTLLISMAIFGAVFDSFLAWQNFVTLSPCRDGVWFCPKCSLCAWTYLTQFIILVTAVLLYFQQSKQSEKTGELFSLWYGIKHSIVALGISAILVGISYLAISAQSNDDIHENENEPPKIALPAVDKVEKIIAQFNKNTKKVSLNTVGLKSVEGPKTAIVEIHKFADFLCPHCLHASLYLKFLRERWPNRVRVYYRFLPLDGACNFLAGGTNPAIAAQRCDSAKAAVCAGEQSPEYFSHFYHGVFDFQNRQVPPEMDALEALAKKYGGDWSKQQVCMASQGQKGINRDLKVIQGWMKSKKLEQPSTPILIINGQLLGAGVPDFRSLIYWVDSMIIAKDGKKAIDDFKKLHSWAGDKK